MLTTHPFDDELRSIISTSACGELVGWSQPSTNP
jgi:hypothetical protein